MEYNDIQEGKIYYYKGRADIKPGPYVVRKFSVDEGEMSLPRYPIYLTSPRGIFIAAVKLSDISEWPNK